MNVLMNLLVALEMLAVNISVVNFCCSRKYSLKRTISRNACTLHTGVFLAISYYILYFRAVI